MSQLTDSIENFEAILETIQNSEFANYNSILTFLKVLSQQVFYSHTHFIKIFELDTTVALEIFLNKISFALERLVFDVFLL